MPKPASMSPVLSAKRGRSWSGRSAGRARPTSSTLRVAIHARQFQPHAPGAATLRAKLVAEHGGKAVETGEDVILQPDGLRQAEPHGEMEGGGSGGDGLRLHPQRLIQAADEIGAEAAGEACARHAEDVTDTAQAEACEAFGGLRLDAEGGDGEGGERLAGIPRFGDAMSGVSGAGGVGGAAPPLVQWRFPARERVARAS
jgi:hypothetical protein